MDIGITSGAGLAASSWNLPRTASEKLSESDTPEKIEGVAKQFEAVMIQTLLKTAREASGGGWLGDEGSPDDESGSLVMDMAEQGMAQAMATRGGLGIAKMVTKNLERGGAKTPNSD
jgi:Rod binding domain-containing protein